MTDDPIVAEVRRIRRQHAERFDDDLTRIFDDLKRSEEYRDRAQSPLLAPPEVGATAPASATRRARFARR